MNTRLLLAAALVLATPLAYAQDATPDASTPSPQSAPGLTQSPSPASPSPQPSADRRGRADHDWGPRRGMDRGGGHERGWDREDMRSGTLLPFGMWWKNPEVATRIGLSAEQQKRIEDLFLQSRVQLIHMHASLQEEQLMLEPLLDATPFDEAKAMEQIDKIADTRADLEKTNAKMLLNIRGVLTADQWSKLRNHAHGMRRSGDDGGDRGPQGPPRPN